MNYSREKKAARRVYGFVPEPLPVTPPSGDASHAEPFHQRNAQALRTKPSNSSAVTSAITTLSTARSVPATSTEYTSTGKSINHIRVRRWAGALPILTE